MSRFSSLPDELVLTEDSLRRIAVAVGNCISRDLVLNCYSFIGASSGLECWRAFIAEPGALGGFITPDHFSWVPAASSREAALTRLLGHCLDFFGVDSVEECELKIAVLGKSAVENLLGISGKS